MSDVLVGLMEDLIMNNDADIKGKVFVVNDNYEEDYTESSDCLKIFKSGDRIIALENNSIPWCVLESCFTGSFNVRDYQEDEIDVMFYVTGNGKPAEEINDMSLAE